VVRLAGRLDDARSALEVGLALGGGPQAARRPVEELDAQALLELGNDLGERGRRHAEVPSGPREAAAVDRPQ